MALRHSPRSIAAVAFALFVVLSGCSAMPLSTDDVSAERIGERAQQKYGSIESFEGTVTTSITTPDRNRTTVAHVVARPNENQRRTEYVAPEPMNGTVIVSNGSVTWSYNESTDTVRRTNLSGVRTDTTGPNYAQLFENVLDRYDVSYEGSASVGDRDTYVIELTPKNGSSTEIVTEWTLWIDKERWFPVRSEMTSRFDNETMTTTTEYTNLTFDVDVPDGTFEFDPPAGATVETYETPTIRQYDSVAAADANSSLDVTAPADLPEGFELTRASTSNGSEFESAILTYGNGSASVVVRQSTRSTPGTDAAETVTVNGREAAVTTYGETTSLTWTCDGRTYSVTGQLPTEDLVAVAESLDCE